METGDTLGAFFPVGDGQSPSENKKAKKEIGFRDLREE